MDKKGQGAEDIFGWILAIILVIVTLVGFFSENICNRLLIGVGIFGLIWLFFGSPIIMRMEHRSGWVFFLPISVVLLVIWIILKATGFCIPVTEFLKSLLSLSTPKLFLSLI